MPVDVCGGISGQKQFIYVFFNRPNFGVFPRREPLRNIEHSVARTCKLTGYLLRTLKTEVPIDNREDKQIILVRREFFVRGSDYMIP